MDDGAVDDGCSVVGRTLGGLLGERVGTNEGCIVDGVEVEGAKVGLVLGE